MTFRKKIPYKATFTIGKELLFSARNFKIPDMKNSNMASKECTNAFGGCGGTENQHYSKWRRVFMNSEH